MIGAVFHQECLLAGRRGRNHVFRWVYGGWLILQFGFYYLGYLFQMAAARRLPGTPIALQARDAAAEFAGSYLELFLVQQFIVALIATPAFVAGAVTDEKTRGTLTYLLTTDLTTSELILGKLLGRMYQVGLVLITGLPLLCFVGVFGGLTPPLLLAVLTSTAAVVFGVAAASVLASVWARSTRDAVLSLYGGLFGIVVLAVLLAQFGSTAVADTVRILDPRNAVWAALRVEEDQDAPGLGVALARTGAIWGGLGVLCLATAIWRLRPTFRRQLESATRRSRVMRFLKRRPPIGDDPIVWKSRYAEDPSMAVMRWVPDGLATLAVFVVTVLLLGWGLYESLRPGMTIDDLLRGMILLDLSPVVESDVSMVFIWVGLLVLLVVPLRVGIRCSGAISGERERQTWEALLLTPIETRALIRGKLRGAFWAVIPFLLAYAVPALLLAWMVDFGAFVTVGIGLLVTALGMFYLGAAGLWCSVRARGSWRALLGTLGWGYVGGFLTFVVTSPVVVIGIMIVYLAAFLLYETLGWDRQALTSSFGSFSAFFMLGIWMSLAMLFVLASWYFVREAEKLVAARERTKHWAVEPPVVRVRRRKVRQGGPPSDVIDAEPV